MSSPVSYPPTETISSQEVSTLLFNHKVEENFANIRKTDEDGHYEVIHFDKCDDNSTTQEKNMRGLIFYKDQLVCKTFNYTPEYFTRDDHLKILNKYADKQISIFHAEEGTLIRVWFHEKWHISTHRKLDAEKSRWGSRFTHGSIFKDAINHLFKEGGYEQFLNNLDKTKIYSFIVRTNNTNRIVCYPLENPTVYFAGEFSSDYILLSTNTSGVNRPVKIENKSPEELLSYLERLNPYETQGLLIYIREDTPEFETIKLTNISYHVLECLRGNTASVRFRYLQLRKDKEQKKAFMDLYSEHLDVFNNCELIFKEVVSEIYSSYIKRYIRKEFVRISQERFYIMKDIYSMYLEGKFKRLNPELISNYLDSLSAERLNYLIKATQTRDKNVE